MIQLYHYPSPNCTKVAIMLEETGLAYRIRFVDVGEGEQFDPEFLAISPNNKVPALVDEDTGERLFESGAILVYLAEKTGKFLPGASRYRVLKWLFWQSGGLGPMAGQAHHFRAFATEKVPYGIRRYTDEMNRLYGVLNNRLATVDYLAGTYSIADMACWPWVEMHEFQGQTLSDFPAVERWFHAIAERPAVQRAMAHGNAKHVDREAYRHLYGQTADTAARYRGEEK